MAGTSSPHLNLSGGWSVYLQHTLTAVPTCGVSLNKPWAANTNRALAGSRSKRNGFLSLCFHCSCLAVEILQPQKSWVPIWGSEPRCSIAVAHRVPCLSISQATAMHPPLGRPGLPPAPPASPLPASAAAALPCPLAATLQGCHHPALLPRTCFPPTC